MAFYQKIPMDDTTPTRTVLKAVVNVVNFLSREMSVGRVPQNKEAADEANKVTQENLDATDAVIIEQEYRLTLLELGV